LYKKTAQKYLQFVHELCSVILTRSMGDFCCGGETFVSVKLQPRADPVSIAWIIFECIWSNGKIISAWEDSKRNISRSHCVGHKFHLKFPGCETGLLSEKSASNRLSYDTAEHEKYAEYLNNFVCILPYCGREAIAFITHPVCPLFVMR
jgi:hypothetical protein